MSQAACNELEKMSWFKPVYANLTMAALASTLKLEEGTDELTLSVSKKSVGALFSKAMLDKAEAFVMDNFGPGKGKELLFSKGFLVALDAFEVLHGLWKREANIRLARVPSRNDIAARDAQHRKKLSLLMAVVASDSNLPIMRMRKFRNKHEAALWLWGKYWRYEELLGECRGPQQRTHQKVGLPSPHAR